MPLVDELKTNLQGEIFKGMYRIFRNIYIFAPNKTYIIIPDQLPKINHNNTFTYTNISTVYSCRNSHFHILTSRFMRRINISLKHTPPPPPPPIDFYIQKSSTQNWEIVKERKSIIIRITTFFILSWSSTLS